MPDHDFRRDQTGRARACTFPRTEKIYEGARSVHRTDVPAARAARTEPGAARALREERVAGSASDAPGDGAACSGPSRAGSSGCTSAPHGARKLGPRPASPAN